MSLLLLTSSLPFWARRKGAGLEEDRKQRRRGEKAGGAAPCGNREGGGRDWGGSAVGRLKRTVGIAGGKMKSLFFFFFGLPAEDDLSRLFRQLTQLI